MDKLTPTKRVLDAESFCGIYGKHFPAPKQNPRPPQRHAPRTQTVIQIKAKP